MATSEQKHAEWLEQAVREDREREVGSLERIADSVHNIERQLYRLGPSLAYSLHVMLREPGARVTLDREPNDEISVLLDLPSRVGTGAESFFQEHASTWSGLPDAIIRLVKAYELTVPLVATPDIPF